MLKYIPEATCKPHFHYIKGLVTHKRKSIEEDLHFIAKNISCLFDLLFYAPFNSFGHGGTLAIERDVKQ